MGKSGMFRQIKLPVEFGVALGDVKTTMQELRKELREVERESSRAIRKGGQIDVALEERAFELRNAYKRASATYQEMRAAPKAPSHASSDHVDLERAATAQNSSVTISNKQGAREMWGDMLTHLPAWAISQSGTGMAIDAVAKLGYYGNALRSSQSLRYLSEYGSKRQAFAADVALGAGRWMSSASSFLLSSPVGAGLAAATAMGSIYQAETRNLLNQAQLRDIAASAALTATAGVAGGATTKTLVRMEQERADIEWAAKTAEMAHIGASPIDKIRDRFGYALSPDTIDAQKRAVQTAAKMSSMRNVLGEAWYRRVTDPDTFRLQIEGRIHREAWGHEGAARAAGFWWNVVTSGGYQNYTRQLAHDLHQEWQNKSADSEMARRSAEETNYNTSIAKALNRVLANETRRHIDAVAREQYSRWTAWATQ